MADDAASGGARNHRPLRHEAGATEAVRPWLGLWLRLTHPPAARPSPPISPWVVGAGVPGRVGKRWPSPRRGPPARWLVVGGGGAESRRPTPPPQHCRRQHAPPRLRQLIL